MQIQGITAFVTEAASGLGAATLRHLAERGARVALFDLPGSAGAELAREIGSAARFASGDVCDEVQVGTALYETADAFGPTRALIDCAGIASAQRGVDRDGAPFPLDAFPRSVEVNPIGSFNAIRLDGALRMAPK